MIDIQLLFDNFARHVCSCKSAEFVLNKEASFESWFRVELVPVLQELGYPIECIDTNYKYPGSGDKADLCVRDNSDIVFELKSFVKSQDANKKQEYPKQIKRLEGILGSGHCKQVIAFTTFVGYSETQLRNYMRLFFTNAKWITLGPSKISNNGKLYLAICTILAE